MTNARPRDARAGFSLYLEASGNITLDQLNDTLMRNGYGEVSNRMIGHYRKLAKVGFNRYISINRFDVARASRAYDSLFSLSRYRYRRANIPVQARFLKGDQLLVVHGLVVESGDVGALVHLYGEALDELRHFRPRAGNVVVLEYTKSRRVVLGVIVDCDLRSDPPLVEVEYAGLHSSAEIEGYSPASTESIVIVVDSDGDDADTIDKVGRRLYHLFDLIEASRNLANRASQYSDDTYYIQPPTLSQLRLSSPLEVVINTLPHHVDIVPWGVVSTLVGGLWISAKIRTDFWRGSLEKAKTQALHQEIRLKEQMVKELESELSEKMRLNLRRAMPGLQLPDSEIDRVISQDVVPPIRRLGENGVKRVCVHKQNEQCNDCPRD